MSRKSYTVYCNQCEALSINGTACHESGCQNTREKWKFDRRHGYCYPENVELPESFKKKEAS